VDQKLSTGEQLADDVFFPLFQSWGDECGYRQRVDQFIQARAFGEIFKMLCEGGATDLVRLLLTDSRIDPSANKNFALHGACRNEHLEVVELLLRDKRVDPSGYSQEALRFVSSCSGGAELVKLLLADSRVDPRCDNDSALRSAARLGHVEVLKALLADPRVDPSISDQWMLYGACDNSRVEVVKLLLAHPRVDSTIHEQGVLRSACSSASNPDVVRLLLADQRVDPSVKNFRIPTGLVSKGNVVLLSLFFLRCCVRKPFSRHSKSAQIEAVESFRVSQLTELLFGSKDLAELCLSYVPDLFCHVSLASASSVDDRLAVIYSVKNLSTL
jgi:hypothetical protein